MYEYDSYLDYLNDELVKRTSINRAYSLRAFAKSLSLSSGELSEILRGVRKLSLKSALKISKAMGLTSTETRHLLSLVEKEQGRILTNNIDTSKKQYNETKLSADQFDIISEWYHFAILNLAECDDFEWSYTYISKKLNIKAYEVKVAIEKMINVGLITKTEKKSGEIHYKISENFIMSTEGIPSKAIRNYHKQILNKAIESLDFQAIEERDISGIGIAIDKKDLASIKKDISEFQDLLVEKYSKGLKERVYQLEIALFALSEEKK